MLLRIQWGWSHWGFNVFLTAELLLVLCTPHCSEVGTALWCPRITKLDLFSQGSIPSHFSISPPILLWSLATSTYTHLITPTAWGSSWPYFQKRPLPLVSIFFWSPFAALNPYSGNCPPGHPTSSCPGASPTIGPHHPEQCLACEDPRFLKPSSVQSSVSRPPPLPLCPPLPTPVTLTFTCTSFISPSLGTQGLASPCSHF
jgi:hypothetical protein